jgi:asparagine synthase (glutamine-hydrolysing)
MLSEKIGIDIHYIWLSNDTTEIVKAYEDTFNAQELPFLGLSVIAQNQVYQKVKEHGVKVLLGGQGADEIFAGYRKFFIQSLKNAVYTNRWSDAISTMYSLGNMLLHEAKYFQTYWQIKDRYFKDSVKGRGYLDFLPEVKIDLIGASDVSLRKRQIQDVQNYSLPTLLRNEDRNSMFHSIESRLPFMDYRLVEAAISLPQALKIKNGFGKWILRDIMKEKVPYAILFNKRKRGFDVTQDWMNNGLKAHLKNSINNNMSHLKKYEIKVDEKLFKEIDEKNEQFMIADLLLLDYLSRK